MVIIPRRIPAALITLVQTRRGQPGDRERGGTMAAMTLLSLSLIRPSSRSLILKIQLNSRNEFQQLLLSPGAPLRAWPSCNVLGNVISAIGVLIVSIFYREEGIGTFSKCQNICTLSTWSTLVSDFSRVSLVSPQVPFLLSNSPFPSVQVKHQDH